MSEDPEQDIPYRTAPPNHTRMGRERGKPPHAPCPRERQKAGPPPWLSRGWEVEIREKDATVMEGCSSREEMTTPGVGAGIRALVPRVPGKRDGNGKDLPPGP